MADHRGQIIAEEMSPGKIMTQKGKPGKIVNQNKEEDQARQRTRS